VAIDDGAVAVISLIERDAMVTLAQELAELPLSVQKNHISSVARLIEWGL
jgi:hypothetical protein